VKLLITGGYGFIGSHFIKLRLARNPGVPIINIDANTYAGDASNLSGCHPVETYQKSICVTHNMAKIMSRADTIVHFAAETHVDRSIDAPDVFIQTNVAGTLNLLKHAVDAGIRLFVYISTDEVYGPLPVGAATELSPLNPTNPYAASKLAAEHMVRAFGNTYGLPYIITRCSNNYGPNQYPEKFIPLMVKRAMADQPLPIYGDGLQVRDWIHVEDHCRALDTILTHGTRGETYNIGAGQRWANINVAKLILNELGKSEDLLEFVPDRPGHDRRYAIDAVKLEWDLRWRPYVDFREGLSETVRWYKNRGD